MASMGHCVSEICDLVFCNCNVQRIKKGKKMKEKYILKSESMFIDS